jgi:chorismate-pyruvate lyase
MQAPINLDAFDPLADLFVAQSARPCELEDLNLRTLTPFQRALLTIDGTVTKFIEAYTMEPIDVVRLAQSVLPLRAAHDWLEAPEGTPVIRRQVLLQGRYSSVRYAYAASLIVPDRISQETRDRLEVDGESLGRILLSGMIETRRDILWYGRERASDVPEPVRELLGDDFLISRAYRIVNDDRVLMLINEKFPGRTDHLPSPMA